MKGKTIFFILMLLAQGFFMFLASFSFLVLLADLVNSEIVPYFSIFFFIITTLIIEFMLYTKVYT